MKLNKIIFTVMVCLGSSYSVWAHEGHEHASNAPTYVKWGLAGMQQLQNLHPAVVHFPIALLLAAVLFYVLGIFLKKEEFNFGGKWLLYFGALSAGIAVWSGLRAANGVMHDEESHLIMMPHQYLGIAIFVLSLIFSGWVFISKKNIPKQRCIFLGMLILLACLIIQQADFGGRLVFLKGVGVGNKNAGQAEILNTEAKHENHAH